MRWRQPEPTRRRALVRLLVLVLLLVATFSAFAGMLRNGWILFDDPVYIFNDPHVSRGVTLDGLLWFLHEPHGGNWHPLTSYSHMLDVQWFGLEPAGHHAVSLGLHMLNALLLALVLWRLTGAWWRSVLVAALFALHPQRVESVAWVAERKDVLSGLFFVLTLEAYRRWAARPGPWRYVLVAVSLALGLMSKPMLVTAPFVLVLLDVWPLGRLKGMSRAPGTPGGPGAPARTLAGLVGEKWPLFLLASASAVVTFVVQQRSGAVSTFAHVPPGLRFGNALLSYWRYIGMTFWPQGLAPFYPYPRALAPGAIAAAAAGLVAVSALAFRQARPRPQLLVGWLWFVGMLVPVIGLIQVGGQACADRYTYLPVIGLLIAIVWLVGEAVPPSRAGRVLATCASVLVLGALSIATARQVRLWKDTRTLFTHTLRFGGESALVENGLATAFEADSQHVEAVRHLRRALELEPDDADLHYNLGIVLGRTGRIQEAEEQLRRALELEPAHPKAAFYLGVSAQAGGRLEEAAVWFRRALDLRPDYAEARDRLGIVRLLQGRAAEGLDLLRSVPDRTPADPRPEFEIGMALLGVREHDAEAAGHLRRAVRDGPGNAAALNALAWLLATSGDPAVRNGGEAVGFAAQAVALSGGRDPNVLDTRAAAEAAAGRFDEAMSTARGASELAARLHLDSLADVIRGRSALYGRGRIFIDSVRTWSRPPGR